ncbi:hypothetical protein FHS83_000725 [Rhizomicrobium palustre]|uniref:Uncharacterized protein n=1 Tax=Rhizomicrobium palustre TaxID=189966 RepID=A0A846MWP2_9PROT|nr:hypothetical protein [Rhizomicrobium palustre]NIK87407.1 hypothetical protein [Rhizomicrobium palustre]
MVDETTPSFGRSVLGKAFSDTKLFFRYTMRDAILAITTLALGVWFAYTFIGKTDTVKEIAFMAAFTFAPLFIVALTIFIWHLWLAPAAITYEAMKSVQQAIDGANIASAAKEHSINWAPWKYRSKFTIYEFAKILAKTDPASQAMSMEGSAFARLILEDVNNRALPYIQEYDAGYGGTKYRVKTSYDTSVKREDALQWAAAKDFSTEHIR